MATTHPKEERTLLLLKPDGVKRGLVGEVVRRVEQRGLKIVGLKMIRPTEAFIKEFLPGTESWKMGMGQKTLDTYSKYNRDPKRELGETDPLKIGEIIFGWLIKFWTSGPAVAIAVSGIHAIDMVRKIVGNTIPAKARWAPFGVITRWIRRCWRIWKNGRFTMWCTLRAIRRRRRMN